MKNIIKKTIKFISSRALYFLIGVFLSIAIATVYAALPAVSPGDPLTAAKWNEMVDKVNELDEHSITIIDKVNELDGRNVTVDINDCETASMTGSTDGGVRGVIDIWRVQCSVGYVMVGLWDDDNSFEDVDLAKCCRIILQ